MFDARNKSQPKLVYAHAHVIQKNLSNEQVQPSLKSTNNVLENKEIVKKQPPLQPESQDTRIQRNPELPSQQQQKEQTRHPDMQRPNQQQQQQSQPKKNAGDFIITTKEPPKTDSVVQKEGKMKAPSQPLNNSVNDYVKRPQENTTFGDNRSDNSNKIEQFEEFRLYRGREFQDNMDKLRITESVQKSASIQASSVVSNTESERKLTMPPSSPSNRHVSVSNSNNIDTGHFNFLRHPRANGSGSSVQRNRPQTHPPPPNQHAHQQLLYQQQQHQMKQLQMQQQILRDHSSQSEEARLRGPVIRVRSYPAGRQQMSASLHPNSNKPGNSGQLLTIPRVSASVSVRPHSLTLPSSRPQDDIAGSQHSQKDFSNYNPSASPRALRSHPRFDSDSSSRQASASNASSSSSSASNPPKSILKNNLNLEQSDLFLSSRPLVLPRAHSEKNPHYVARDFDFSSILTANKDPLSAKITTIQVKGQVHGQTMAPANQPHSQPQRPATAGPTTTKSELNQNGRPIRKSVTFNSLVRLHHEDQAPTVKALPGDA